MASIAVTNESIHQFLAPLYLEFEFRAPKEVSYIQDLARETMRMAPFLGYSWRIRHGRMHLESHGCGCIKVRHRTRHGQVENSKFHLYGDAGQLRTSAVGALARIALGMSKSPIEFWLTNYAHSARLRVQMNHAACDGYILMGILSKAAAIQASKHPQRSTRVYRSVEDARVPGYIHRRFAGSEPECTTTNKLIAHAWRLMVRYFEVGTATTVLRTIVSTRNPSCKTGTMLTSRVVCKMTGTAVLETADLHETIAHHLQQVCVLKMEDREAQQSAFPASFHPDSWVKSLKLRGETYSSFALHINAVNDAFPDNTFADGNFVSPSLENAVSMRDLPATRGTDAWMVRILQVTPDGSYGGDLVIM